MGYGDGAVEPEGDLPLVGVLVLGQEFFFRVARISRVPRSLRNPRIIPLIKALVNLLEEGRVVIERLQIEGAVDVQTTVAADGIAEAGAVVELGTAYPTVVGII